MHESDEDGGEKKKERYIESVPVGKNETDGGISKSNENTSFHIFFAQHGQMWKVSNFEVNVHSRALCYIFYYRLLSIIFARAREDCEVSLSTAQGNFLQRTPLEYQHFIIANLSEAAVPIKSYL